MAPRTQGALATLISETWKALCSTWGWPQPFNAPSTSASVRSKLQLEPQAQGLKVQLPVSASPPVPESPHLHGEMMTTALTREQGAHPPAAHG